MAIFILEILVECTFLLARESREKTLTLLDSSVKRVVVLVVAAFALNKVGGAGVRLYNINRVRLYKKLEDAYL